MTQFGCYHDASLWAMAAWMRGRWSWHVEVPSVSWHEPNLFDVMMNSWGHVKVNHNQQINIKKAVTYNKTQSDFLTLSITREKKIDPSGKHSVLGWGWWNIPKSALWITSDTELVDVRVRAYSTQLGVSDAIWSLKVGGESCSSVLPKPLLWLPIHTHSKSVILCNCMGEPLNLCATTTPIISNKCHLTKAAKMKSCPGTS